jgi:hypothetical protein
MKTMHELREMLSEEIDSIRAKKTTPGAVNAICNATGKFLSTIKLEMEFAKMIGKEPSINFIKLMDRPSETQLPVKKKAA